MGRLLLPFLGVLPSSCRLFLFSSGLFLVSVSLAVACCLETGTLCVEGGRAGGMVSVCKRPCGTREQGNGKEGCAAASGLRCAQLCAVWGELYSCPQWGSALMDRGVCVANAI